MEVSSVIGVGVVTNYSRHNISRTYEQQINFYTIQALVSTNDDVVFNSLLGLTQAVTENKLHFWIVLDLEVFGWTKMTPLPPKTRLDKNNFFFQHQAVCKYNNCEADFWRSDYSTLADLNLVSLI